MPFLSKKVEHNLEVFLFGMGLAASALAGALNLQLAAKALREPIMISLAVLVAGLAFRALGGWVRKMVWEALVFMPLGLFLFLLVVLLGLLSSVITAIIASLVLVEVISILSLPRRLEIGLDVIACFSIGLGAALTPIGEPLATIATSKLGQGFWYLFLLLGRYIVPGIVGFGLAAALYLPRLYPEFETRRRLRRPEGAAVDGAGPDDGGGAVAVGRNGTEGSLESDEQPETYRDVLVRALKVYLFVMALVLLGEGFKPVIDRFVVGLGAPVLYWLNTVSAVLDNATLTAAEISARMNGLQVEGVLMGLLIAGGMLIPGNIPNIISAGKLKIGSREWARLGVPFGLAVMVVYFVVLFVL